ncbi:hypothetical protein [Streptomyces sp. NPDC007905]|uniref:hypothetical protein n=1 Tax=Streptomyces sp. NPDC007905 TaxID=3364788 RepID=UPI0036EF6851
MDRDGRADLTAVAAQENAPEGAVRFLPGASSTLYSTTASTSFGPAKAALPAGRYTGFAENLADQGLVRNRPSRAYASAGGRVTSKRQPPGMFRTVVRP